ncbi:MAG TPA: hypothetical protein VEJ87_05565 [Acidimicrobiales bacterium]|nr:hypothetical protein [Acidimicrobiales bacterium]
MRRRTFDILASFAGGALVVVLLVAGALLMWGYSFANSNVHNQLAEQQIFFPTKAQLAHPNGTEITKGMVPYLEPYAGQQVLNGAQAETYANHFIAVHLSELPMNGVYSQLSEASRANPGNVKLAALVQTSFQGTTLRGLLLEAYGFWQFGQIALWAGIASFILAGVTLILVIFGLLHARRTEADLELLGSRDKEATKAA